MHEESFNRTEQERDAFEALNLWVFYACTLPVAVIVVVAAALGKLS
jgi:hypothetical protein